MDRFSGASLVIGAAFLAWAGQGLSARAAGDAGLDPAFIEIAVRWHLL